MAELKGFLVRTASAIVGIVLVVAVVWAGAWPLAAFTALVAGLATFELSRMTRATDGRVGEALAVGISAALPLAAAGFGSRGLVAVLVAGVAVVLLRMLVSRQVTLPATALTVFAYSYVGLLLSFLMMIRRLSAAGPGPSGGAAIGAMLVIVAFVGTWLNDIAAYVVGITMGRHKLAPRVSPGKTWEGTVGGFAVTVGVFKLAAWLLAPRLLASPSGPDLAVRVQLVAYAAVLGALISLAAIVGDLVESKIKRESAAKDAGRLIPGHGGVLDRFDSLLFVAPAVYAALRLMGWH